jgi:hypothetical protein
VTEINVVFHQKCGEISRDLWERCLPPPLEGVWWYETLEESQLEDQFEFLYAVAWLDQEAVAIAPLFVMDVPIEIVAPPVAAWMLRQIGRIWPSFAYQRTLFIGSPCSDEGTVGTLPGIDLAIVAPALQRAVAARAEQLDAAMIVWKDLSPRSVPALRSICASAGLFEVVSYPGTIIRDAGGSFEGYLRQLSGRRRHRLRKKLRRSRDAVSLYSEVVARPEATLVDDIWSLFQNTYQKADLKFERLTKTFWRRITQCEVSRLIILRDTLTRRPLAFMLVFLTRGWAINKFIGMDYSLAKESYLYFRLWEEFVRWTQTQGVVGVQSGQTCYQAKLDLGHDLVPLTNFACHRNPIIHLIFAGVAKGISWSSLDAELQAFIATDARRTQKKMARLSHSGSAPRHL